MENNKLLRIRGSRVLGAGLLCCVLLGASPLASADTGVQAGSSYLLSSNQNVVVATSNNFGGQIASSGSAASVPEPSTWAMFGLGALLIGGGLAKRRKRFGGLNQAV